MRVSVAELYGAAAMLNRTRLVELLRPDAPDFNAPEARGWTEEEFDGSIRLAPHFAKMIELCAKPDIYGAVTIHKRQSQAEYRVYLAKGEAVCLRSEEDGYIADSGDIAVFVNQFANEIPVGGASEERLALTQEEAARSFAEAESVIRIIRADFTAESAEDEIAAQNWVALYCGGLLWQIDESGGNVSARVLGKDALHAELTGIFQTKGRD
jgi:hypothetical protein